MRQVDAVELADKIEEFIIAIIRDQSNDNINYVIDRTNRKEELVEYLTEVVH